MTQRNMLARLRAGLLAFAVALAPAPAPPTVTAASGMAAGVAAGVAAGLYADPVEARSRTSSSSSSRSSSSSYSRSSSSSSSSRTPSYSSYSSSSKASAADKAVSRQNSARALESYRKSQEPAAAAGSRSSIPPSGSAGRASSSSSSSSWSWPSSSSSWGRPSASNGANAAPRRPSADAYAPYRRYDPRWTPPAYATQGARRFGFWDAAMVWFLLDTLTRPGHAAFFHDNAEDPDLKQWRGEADKLARSDPELQARLTALDAAAAAQAETPRQPGRVPDDVADKIVYPDETADGDGEDADIVIGLIVLAAAAALLIAALYVAFLFWRKVFRFVTGRTGAAASSPKARSPQAGEKTVFDMFKGKGEARAPFRVGMTVTVDPSPFLLAGDAVKVKQPAASPGGLTNVQGVGVLNSPALTLHRLYLTDGDFLQIHLDKQGSPDECRLFHVIDEIDPADESEWGQWLSKREGMIGWRDFQTPDGKVYQRVWSPGPAHIAPVKLHESEDSAEGMTLTNYECMLYRAATGLDAPAPESEYLLLSAVERDGQAWVEIAAGIDVNPASLSLT